MAMQVYETVDVTAQDFSELSCKECAKSGRHVDSLNFCVGCKSLYCLECLQDHKEEDGKIGEQTRPKNGISKLPETNNNNRSHSKDCKLLKPNEDRHLIDQLNKLKVRINKMMDAETAAKQVRLDQLQADTEQKLNHLKSCVDKLIKEIKSSLTEAVTSIHDHIEEQYSVKVETLARLKTKTEAALTHIKRANNKNKFDELKAFVNQTKDEMHQVEHDTEGYFGNITQHIKQAEHQTRDAILADAMDDFICHFYALVNNISNDNFGVGGTEDEDIPYVQCNIQAAGDKSVCDINSSCILEDGSVILTGWNNSNIKLLNKNFDLINVCSLHGIPWAVCRYSNQQVLVSLYLLQRIQWVDIKDGELFLGKSFKVRNPCKGIASCDDKIFVSCGGNGIMECQGQVQVYNLEGRLLQTFVNKDSEKSLLSDPQHLAVTQCRSENIYKVFVADKDSGLVVIDITEGRSNKLAEKAVKKVDTNGRLTEAKGICRMNDHRILLSDFKHGNIVEIECTEDEYRTQNIISSQEIIVHPNSICFDDSSMRLIVTKGSSNEIQVYDLTNIKA